MIHLYKLIVMPFHYSLVFNFGLNFDQFWDYLKFVVVPSLGEASFLH